MLPIIMRVFLVPDIAIRFPALNLLNSVYVEPISSGSVYVPAGKKVLFSEDGFGRRAQ
jgi:hypothetical protein